jgi:hypothetical protein
MVAGTKIILPAEIELLSPEALNDYTDGATRVNRLNIYNLLKCFHN